MSFQHQDWETVVIRNKNAALQKERETKGLHAFANSTLNTAAQNANKAKQQALQSASSKPAWKIEQRVDDPDAAKPIDYVSKEVSRAIIQGRVNLKLSQKDLAQKAHMMEAEIKKIENGTAVENRAVIAKLKRILQI